MGEAWDRVAEEMVEAWDPVAEGLEEVRARMVEELEDLRSAKCYCRSLTAVGKKAQAI